MCIHDFLSRRKAGEGEKGDGEGESEEKRKGDRAQRKMGMEKRGKWGSLRRKRRVGEGRCRA